VIIRIAKMAARLRRSKTSPRGQPGQAQGNAEARGFALGQDQRLKPAPSSSLTWDRSFQLAGQTKWGAAAR
jgi:hypothetical protein